MAGLGAAETGTPGVLCVCVCVRQCCVVDGTRAVRARTGGESRGRRVPSEGRLRLLVDQPAANALRQSVIQSRDWQEFPTAIYTARSMNDLTLV